MNDGMSKPLGIMIAVLAFVGTTIIVAMITYLTSLSADAAIIASFLWIGIYGGWNIRIVGQQDWQVVERFGQFYAVKFAGFRLYCMLGLIDRIVKSGNFRMKTKDLFANSKGEKEEVDFKDDSAPIVASIQFRVGEPNQKSTEKLEEAVRKYVYSSEGEPEIVLVKIAEDLLRPKLQKETFDDAQEKRGTIANGSKDEISAGIEPFGLYLWTGTSVLIEDIILSSSTKELRQKRLRGQTTAEEMTKAAAGIHLGIKAIAESLGIDNQAAAKIWQQQQTTDMFKQTGSNITIIADSGDGVVKTMDVSNKK